MYIWTQQNGQNIPNQELNYLISSKVNKPRDRRRLKILMGGGGIVAGGLRRKLSAHIFNCIQETESKL